MTETEYWKWFEEYVEEQILTDKFGHIHPYVPRKVASEVFGIGMNPVALWEFEKVNHSKIARIINKVAKRYGMRLSKKRFGYAKVEKIR